MSIRIGDDVWSLPEQVEDLIEKIERSIEKIERSIDGLPGDPGSMCNIDERVHRVIDALQDKIRVLESRGRR